nr:uncharacterized protein CTRU02_13839 [Colletotrichum truncatum]KAF6782841.1 hypothetical protein CTRU02_13839 [Colletotrichum truncatum]
MDGFCNRLLSFYDNNVNGEPGRWPVANLQPEDMAGAGFRFAGNGKLNCDSVSCDWCKMQAWKWESKDDPFEQHRQGSPTCIYVASKTFKDYEQVFQAKVMVSEVFGRLPSPPATPVKQIRKPRRRMCLSPITTVFDFEPAQDEAHSVAYQQESTHKPVEISVMSGDTKVVIQIANGEERSLKRLRME